MFSLWDWLMYDWNWLVVLVIWLLTGATVQIHK